MKVTLQLYNCLAPEFLVTVQLSNPIHIKVLKGIEPSISLDKINVSNKHAVISQEFDLSSDEAEVNVIVAWPKERRYCEWKFSPSKYNEDLDEMEMEEVEDCFKYYINKDGIFYSREKCGENYLPACSWKRLKKIDELRGSSGRLMEIQCTEDTTQLRTHPD